MNTTKHQQAAKCALNMETRWIHITKILRNVHNAIKQDIKTELLEKRIKVSPLLWRAAHLLTKLSSIQIRNLNNKNPS